MRAFVEKRPPRYMKLRELAAAGESSEFMWGPYKLDCPACGAQGMPAGFEFCGACGTELDGAQTNGGEQAAGVEGSETAEAGTTS
jgi:hypothetical protein